MPTSYTDIYLAWNLDVDGNTTTTAADIVWDFGVVDQYPALKAAWNTTAGATWEEFGTQMRELPPPVDYDTDDDGLIEVGNLEQLNAIRYDRDGDGAVAGGEQSDYGAAFPATLGGSDYGAIICGDGGTITLCSGYELVNNLDFNDADGSGSGTAVSRWRRQQRVRAFRALS